MNIYDLFISKLRKIDPSDKFSISEVINKSEVIRRALEIIESNAYAIILDEQGIYKDEILRNGGLYKIVKKVSTGMIDLEFVDKSEDEDVIMTDYSFIGIGFRNNFAEKSLRKQSMGLGLSLTDFFLVDAKRIEDYKYIFVSSEDILNHWGFKSDKKILDRRNFKYIIVKDS